MMYRRMFSQIWIFMETVALIGIFCFLLFEIMNGTMQEEKMKAEAAAKDAEGLKVIIRKMNEGTSDLGFYFKQNNGRFEAYHTYEWYAKDKARRLEFDNLRKDVHHFDKMTDKMIALVERHGLEFKFKSGRCVDLVSK